MNFNSIDRNASNDFMKCKFYLGLELKLFYLNVPKDLAFPELQELRVKHFQQGLAWSYYRKR